MTNTKEIKAYKIVRRYGKKLYSALMNNEILKEEYSDHFYTVSSQKTAGLCVFSSLEQAESFMRIWEFFAPDLEIWKGKGIKRPYIKSLPLMREMHFSNQTKQGAPLSWPLVSPRKRTDIPTGTIFMDSFILIEKIF